MQRYIVDAAPNDTSGLPVVGQTFLSAMAHRQMGRSGEERDSGPLSIKYVDVSLSDRPI